MKLLRATHLGMCFGVRDAIALAEQQAECQPVTVLGELVHNHTVLRDLTERGVRFAGRLEQVTTPTVIITAHGASEQTLRSVRAAGFNLVEATCPLVHVAHRAVRELAGQGFHPIIIGKRDHVEVRGLTGDLVEFDVILTEAEIETLKVRPRFGVVAQTTQPIERVRALVASMRRRFPDSEICFRDTVCQPTKQRQDAAIELAQQCDVVVVIGGAHSNNTRELVATCLQHCDRVQHVQSDCELRKEWFLGAQVVGITAGTSTPDHVIDAVEQWLRAFAESRQTPRPALAA